MKGVYLPINISYALPVKSFLLEEIETVQYTS